MPPVKSHKTFNLHEIYLEMFVPNNLSTQILVLIVEAVVSTLHNCYIPDPDKTLRFIASLRSYESSFVQNSSSMAIAIMFAIFCEVCGSETDKHGSSSG